MATDFWASSHHKRWVVDRASVKRARAEDLLYVDDPEYLDFLAIFFANCISRLGKKLQLRQRVIATATVFFRRFYLKNSYCETDPFLVIAACCYVAAKAEESPLPIKNVVSDARFVFSQEMYGIKTFPSDTSKLAEMEFYLVDDLECDLTIFHPYRTLMTLCYKEGSNVGAGGGADGNIEAGELGAGIDDGQRYWGTGEGRLELHEGALQMAWFIINDTYRSDLCLLYPPHLIAIAAIYLALVLHTPTRTLIQSQTAPGSSSASATGSACSGPTTANPTPAPVRRSSRQASNASSSSSKKNQQHHQPQDFVGFMASLNVSMPLIATIAQEIISLYTLWDRYKEDSPTSTSSLDSSAKGSFTSNQGRHNSPFTTGTKRSATGTNTSRSGSVTTNVSASAGTGSHAGTPMDIVREDGVEITPVFLVKVLLKMREGKWTDLAARSGLGEGGDGGGNGPRAVNKILGRTQAAG
ncbi:hypothetical protein JAAARDRAFT_117818 [Jaapia argillacea MUCL 33604]|uniref:Cyclin-like domain-containing protein n=1 Tax=Jaapia argillacea MUCL 33604 TaxID=933084 RepID=A0A067QR36_9AGAM|nr:hypothetical protein JAAARDRAFT_117818 [Jaapia argillacea MUCL 33604]